MTIIEHLEEFRSRLVFSALAVAVGSVGGWFLFFPVTRLLRGPYCDALRSLPEANRPPSGCNLLFSGAVDAFSIRLKVVVFLGFALALPVVLFQLWRFIVPGLTSRERHLAIPFVLSSVVLFALGGLFAYLVLPRGLSFLLGFAGEGFVPLLTADKYLGFVMLVTLAFGLSFEFPIVLIFLGWAGVVSAAQLRKWRRYTILFLAIFAAVITPTGDPVTMSAMMIPMYLFYEAAILIVRFLKK